MTTEKMPDVIWADRPNDNVGVYFDHKPQYVSVKYLRSEPVEKLLKQARNMLNSWDEDYAPAPPYHFDLVDKIDKFLGGRNDLAD